MSIKLVLGFAVTASYLICDCKLDREFEECFFHHHQCAREKHLALHPLFCHSMKDMACVRTLNDILFLLSYFNWRSAPSSAQTKSKILEEFSPKFSGNAFGDPTAIVCERM